MVLTTNRIRVIALAAVVIVGVPLLGQTGNYDGYNDIDWDGPKVMARTPLDFTPFLVDTKIQEFTTATAGIASSVPARPLTYAQALANVKGLFTSAVQKERLAALRATTADARQFAALEPVGIFAAMRGSLAETLAVLLVRHEAAPNNPTTLFNLASALTQAGMPNEAIAMLDRIASIGMKPDVAFDFRPEAALDYQRGYAQMMIGKLGEAQTLLRRAFAIDDNLTDAIYALAIIERALGGDVRKSLLKGVWRLRSSKPPMYVGSEYDKDPLTEEVDQLVALQADALFDLSKGTDGVLPRLSHPANGEQLLKLMEYVRVDSPKLMAEVISNIKAADEIYGKELAPRLDKEAPDAQDLVNQGLFDMMDPANAHLKPLQRMFEQQNKRVDEYNEVIERSGKAMEDKYRALATEKMSVEARKALGRDMVSSGMAMRRPSLNAYDNAVRVQFRAWHKYATGLAGLMTDKSWHQYADLRIRAWTAAEWNSLYANVVASYSTGLPVTPDIYAPDAALPKPPGLEVQELWHCDPSARPTRSSYTPAKQLGLPAVTMTAQIDCEQASFMAEGNLVEASTSATAYTPGALGSGVKLAEKLGGLPKPISGSLGIFGEISVQRKGDITLYSGARGSLSGLGGAGTTRAGAYVTRDSDGIKEIGLRVDVPGQPGAGTGLKKFVGRYDDPANSMLFTVWAAPPRPPKFSSQTGLTIWGNR